jgi:LuxR family maltose regulon positive regulatory protein
LTRTQLPAVVLVSAPAGFGKTTLLTEWLAAVDPSGKRTAWVSLDRRDSDPSLFWSYVIAALRKVNGDMGSTALDTLASSPAVLEDVVGALLNDLADVEGAVLVLDDYHVVESVDVHESMRFLLQHLPSQVHLVVASRADPPWPLAALRARGELLEVRAGDLRFTSAETTAYLNDASELDLTAAEVETLEARTEGWIAALQLAALSLRGRDDSAAFIAEFAGDDRFVVDYLVDEVLDRLTEDIRSFLVATSILSRLTAPLCAAVTGHVDAKSALDTLERLNLFVIALDDRRQWYRYHHLFRDVLRARLITDDPELARELHRRASDWHEAEGDRTEAVRHATAAEDFARVAELVELAVPALRRSRQDLTQREWLEAIPEWVFTNRPVLNMARVGARMVTGDVEGVEAILDDIEGWLEPHCQTDGMIVHDHEEFARLPSQVSMYRAGLALLRSDLVGAVAHGEQTASLCLENDHLGRGAAAALIGLASWTGGDLESAERHYAAAIDEFEAAEHFADILGCSLGLADIRSGLGQLDAAQRTLAAGLDLAVRSGPLRGTADMHIGLAEIHLERNELEAAASQLRRSSDAGERLALPQHAHRWRTVDARLRSINGDLDGALILLREAAQLYDTDYSPPARPVSAITARVLLEAGDINGAQQWVAEAGVEPDDELTYLREYEHLTLARVLLATERAPDALRLLERLCVATTAGRRTGRGIEAGLLLALAHMACGQSDAALSTIAPVLVRAEQERHIRIFLDAGAPAIALLKAAIRQGKAPEQARRLLSIGTDPPRPQPGLVDALSPRELDVLRLLRTDLTGPEIAAQLLVSLNTVRTHTKNIFTKLGVTNRRAAVRRAAEVGL